MAFLNYTKFNEAFLHTKFGNDILPLIEMAGLKLEDPDFSVKVKHLRLTFNM